MTKLNSTGKVSLVGAGPGAMKLITLRGCELLREADVVLYDGLVNDEVLQLANPRAELLCVGKHGHGGMWSQQEIDAKTISFAKEGKQVVRLKGGDTAIFARTSEEVEHLVAGGIPYEIVPGITAALAATAYAGVPLTHRDWASAVAFVTGQMQPSDGSLDSDEGMDWKGLAAFPGTLVLYMGVTTAARWSQQLMEAGKSPRTPVALVRRVSWNDQQVLRCQLDNVAETIQGTPGFRPPVISIIGDVAQLTESMSWFVDRPLFGKRFLIPSTERTGGKLRSALNDLGATTTLQPAVVTTPITEDPDIDATLRSIAEFDWVLFTSPTGVDRFFQRFDALGLDARKLGAVKIGSIGQSTSEALVRHRIHPDCTPESPSIENLVPLLAPEAKGKRFLFVRPPEGRTIGQELLTEAGGICQNLELYRQQPVSRWPDIVLENCRKGKYDGVIVTSLNIAEQVVALIAPSHTTQTWYSISPRVSARLRELGCTRIHMADRSDIDGVLECVVEGGTTEDTERRLKT